MRRLLFSLFARQLCAKRLLWSDSAIWNLRHHFGCVRGRHCGYDSGRAHQHFFGLERRCKRGHRVLWSSLFLYCIFAARHGCFVAAEGLLLCRRSMFWTSCIPGDWELFVFTTSASVAATPTNPSFIAPAASLDHTTRDVPQVFFQHNRCKLLRNALQVWSNSTCLW